MFFPAGQIRVYLYGAPADMRRSYDGLCALTKNAMGQDPMSGSLFVYINKRGTQTKILCWDCSGFCLGGMRLEAGRFVSDWRSVASREMDWTRLKLLLDGIEPGRVSSRQRHSILHRRHPADAVLEHARQMRLIGINLNQIARQLNLGKDPGNSLAETVEKLALACNEGEFTWRRMVVAARARTVPEEFF